MILEVFSNLKDSMILSDHKAMEVLGQISLERKKI